MPKGDGESLPGFGARMRLARREAGMTQVELAEAADITQPTISLWETGRGGPSATTLVRLADVLSVQLTWLATGDAPGDGNRQSAATDPVFASWQQTPRGKLAAPLALAFLERLDVTRYKTSHLFYDLALTAYEAGLELDDVASAASATARRVTDK